MTFAALDSALTGPLFGAEAMRACFSDQSRLRAMLAAEAALAAAEAEVGLAPDALADAIRAIQPDRLDAAAIGQDTALAGVPSIPFVRAVQAQLPPELERSFHKGATTQDILDTALVLQLREALALVSADLSEILAGLSRLAARYRDTPCAGRTYGQHAAPVTFGYKAAVWLAGIAEAAERLPPVRARVLTASLAGPVGTLSGLGAAGPAVADGFARALGLGSAPIAWHTRRGRIAETGCWLAEVIGALAKLATDVAHLASTEVGEASEPQVPGRGGSSAMPHKRNPVSCTVILSAHAAAPALAATLLGAMAAADERPAGLWHAEWHALPTLFGLASGALHETKALATGLTIDPDRMSENLGLTRGLLFADAAAALLAETLGREAAHARVQHAAGQVRQTGRTLQAVLEGDPALRGIDFAPAFSLEPTIAAAGSWIGRATRDAARVQARLQDG